MYASNKIRKLQKTFGFYDLRHLEILNAHPVAVSVCVYAMLIMDFNNGRFR